MNFSADIIGAKYSNPHIARGWSRLGLVSAENKQVKWFDKDTFSTGIRLNLANPNRPDPPGRRTAMGGITRCDLTLHSTAYRSCFVQINRNFKNASEYNKRHWEKLTMNQEEFRLTYLRTLEFLGLPKEEVVVSAGGALLMLGLRQETADMDLDVPETCFLKHKRPDNVELFGSVEAVALNGCVSLHVADPMITTTSVDGVTIYAIEELIEQKQWLLVHPQRTQEKRQQDKRDLAALNKLVALSIEQPF